MRPMPELEVVKVPTIELVEYRNNAKLHPIEQIDQIAQSIWEFGFNNPILAWHNDDGEPEIVAGHGRLMAARKLGLRELPVVFLDHMTEEQRRAYILVDNQLTMNSGFDEDTLESELARIFEIDMEQYDFTVDIDGDDEEEELEPADVDEDELPEISQTRVKTGQIWALGDHRLVCGDSTDPNVVAALMGDEKADMLLTDPPYNVDYASKNEMLSLVDKMNRIQDDIENDQFDDSGQYQKFIEDALSSSVPHLRRGAAFYVWFAAWHTRLMFDACDAVGLQVRQNLYWVKNNIVLGRQDYQWQTEPCIYGWTDGPHWFAPTRKEHNVIDDMADLRGMDKKQLIELAESLLLGNEETDVIRVDKPMVSADNPTTKPVALFARLIRNSTAKGQTVLDVFAGSGTTAMACEQMGRKARMVEISEGYCDVILERWERFTGETAELIGSVE